MSDIVHLFVIALFIAVCVAFVALWIVDRKPSPRVVAAAVCVLIGGYCAWHFNDLTGTDSVLYVLSTVEAGAL